MIIMLLSAELSVSAKQPGNKRLKEAKPKIRNFSVLPVAKSTQQMMPTLLHNYIMS